MQQLRHGWRIVTERIGPLGVVAAILAVLGLVILVLAYTVPAFVGSILLQVLGAALLGAGLSALVGAVTGREAIHQQSAREANLVRKRDTYGPLYAELKALRGAFAEAETGAAPLPLWIDNGVEVKREGVTYFPAVAPGPTLQCWPEFRRDYRDTDFTPSVQNLLNEVQALATTYNTAIEAARQAAIPILASHADSAITALQQREDYKQWQLLRTEWEQVPHVAGFGGWKATPQDWYGYIQFIVETVAAPRGDTPGQQLAAQWLGRWPDIQPSHAPGWLLAGHPDKAAEYVKVNYPTGMEYPPPPLDWIHDMFIAAWPELQQASTFRAAVEAGATLFRRVQAAEEILAAGLLHIQERYEGGTPLV